MKNSIRSAVLAAAVAGAFGFAPTANADVLATSVIQLSNLLFSNNATGITLDITDFALINGQRALTYTNTGDVGASFTGFPSAGVAGSGTPLDLPLVCSGPSCPPPTITANGFQAQLIPGSGNFAAGDQNELGAPITGLGLPTPAQVESGAWGHIETGASGVASGTANNGLTGSFIFTLGTSMAVDIDFAATYAKQASVTAGELFPAFAQSRGTTNFNIVDLTTGTTVYNFSPADLNWNISLNAPIGSGLTINLGNTNQLFSDTTPVLTGGVPYQLSMREETLADVQRIPEPGTLALLGAALLGLFGLGRRKLTLE
jgi:hypothetical protein